MVKKIKKKFIILAATAFFALLAIVITAVNVINYTGFVADADEVLDFISQNKGKFPSFEDIVDKPIPDRTQRPGKNDEDKWILDQMSPELPYESRFFSVLLDENEMVIHSDVSKIASVDEENAEEYAREALSRSKDRGFINKFRYLVTKEDKTIRIVFLDCESKFEFIRNFLITSCLISFFAFLLVFIILTIAAGWIIHPIIESYEKQKRFIADAGHEIKTPLTIINANVDVLEMDLGDNESLKDIQSQSARLATLTDKLVFLSRMEESHEDKYKIKFDLSATAEEITDSFKALAESKGKSIKVSVQQGLIMNGDQIEAGQILSIFLENALKYSPSDSEICVEVAKQGKWINMSVENVSSYPLTNVKLESVFERFYRIEESRSSNVSGYGIGLSIARAIVETNSGRISVESRPDNKFRITASFQHA